MKQKITINDKTYDVEVGDLMSSPIQVIVNGKEYDVILETTGPEPSAARPIATPVAPTTVARPAMVSKPRSAPAAAPVDSGNDIRSPMPGTILEINIQVGSKVKVGQQVCTLEAMKMKNAIRSTKEGVIASVDVTTGQKVNFGDVLVRFA